MRWKLPCKQNKVDKVFEPLEEKRDHAGTADSESIGLEKKVSSIVVQTAAEEEECKMEQDLHNQVHLMFRRWLQEVKILLQT